jgi:hypothetical protein
MDCWQTKHTMLCGIWGSQNDTFLGLRNPEEGGFTLSRNGDNYVAMNKEPEYRCRYSA